ncbi:MAG: GIY-YIG nuclease family protein [Reichenbachiella sp.]|uniref:GIY-YIG nuclease family protein n=1 Tax=Reichenbachiella sp. TaxID=2184521 RepID=UPI003265245E
MVTLGKVKDRISDSNWFLYTLKLEESKYYIGTAIDPEQRFSEHQEQGKNCSSWCKKFKALEILEAADTGLKRMKDATLLEDILTLNYIRRYGAANVRGGRYIGSERKVQKSSEQHLNRGYITVMHRLLEKFNITFHELSELGLNDFVMDNRNEAFLNNLIVITSNSENPKTKLLEKITKAQQTI